MSKYPPVELMHQWGLEACSRITGANAQVEHIARKACDWQRQQDAIAAESAEIPESCNPIERILCNCIRVQIASAIREPSQ